MSWKHFIAVGLLFAVMAAVSMMPLDARADTQPLIIGCKNYIGLTNHIAGCVRDSLDAAAAKFFDQFYPYLSRTITWVMVLSVTIFGVMASFGMLEKVGRDSMMLLLKLAMVSYFATNSDYVYDTVISIMDSSAEAVVSYAPNAGPSDNSGTDFTQINCLKHMRAVNDVMGNGQNGIVGPWLAMDCMLDTVIGIKVRDNQRDAINLNTMFDPSKNGLSRGMVYLFFSAFTSSSLGMVMGIVGFLFIVLIVHLIIRALFIYLAGYIGLALMAIFTPIFVPMVLFQSTKIYFDKWIKLLISFALQPVVILVFVVFTVAAVDLATFSGDYSIMYRIAGKASRQPGFNLNHYLTCTRANEKSGSDQYSDSTQCLCLRNTAIINQKCANGIIVDTLPDKVTSAIEKKSLEFAKVLQANDVRIPTEKNPGGILSNIETSECTQAAIDNDPKLKEKCGNSYPLKIFRESINWQLLGKIRDPAVILPPEVTDPPTPKVEVGQQMSREVLASIIFAVLVVFIMGQLLRVIPMMAYDLVGDFGQSPNLVQVGGVLPQQDKISAALKDRVTSTAR